MEQVAWQIEGMDCANCALSIQKVVAKNGGSNILINPVSGKALFSINDTGNLAQLKNTIQQLGYQVLDQNTAAASVSKKLLSTHVQKLWFCLPFTLVLIIGHIGMSFNWHFLHNSWWQLLICLPVYTVGMQYFGKSAINSIRAGVPNMNVLIAVGATAAFVYSVIGTITNHQQYIFFETAASIVTLVFFGNFLEDYAIAKTQKTIQQLTKQEKLMANMIAYDAQYNENIFAVESTALKVGDLVLINTGEQVPADCKILSGTATVNEALLTGESEPIHKQQNDIVIGGSLLVSGTIKCYVTAVGNETVLQQLVSLVQQAQNEKPPVQILADKISAVFVPTVIAIAIATLLVNYFVVNTTFTESMMRSIAVLVISCPCAMGLATPAALAVGMGRAAKNGILFTNGKSIELFKQLKYMVFDKTGTLTTGNFVITNYHTSLPIDEFKKLIYSIEKHSNHPIAKSIATAYKGTGSMVFKAVEEIKGQGMKAIDKEGNIFVVGNNVLANLPIAEHNIYILKNRELIGWMDVQDELRAEAATIITYCKTKGIDPILLSGDSKEKCAAIATTLGIQQVYAQQSPAEKLAFISNLTSKGITAMVGDGINDAAALAKAHISISLSGASKLAIQQANVVLMNSGLQKLPFAVGLGKNIYATIQGNLFWAFVYNIVAIPIAAIGLLTPIAGAFIMAFSDVVLAINSLRLQYKKVS
jgi:P-type Cu+ transporter